MYFASFNGFICSFFYTVFNIHYFCVQYMTDGSYFAIRTIAKYSSQAKNRRSLVRTPGSADILSELMKFIERQIHSSPNAVHCFEYGYVGKLPVAWEEHCGNYWLKEHQESTSTEPRCKFYVTLHA